MKKNQVSISAQGIAFARALESSKPANERVCDDPFTRQFISPAFYWLVKFFAGYARRVGPGVLEFLAARCRYIDDYLQTCLDAGIQQLVILGAGLDSRAYRFTELKQRVRVFEVDQPATQQVKRDKVRKLFRELPSHVTFVPIDFNTESLQKLYQFGYDRKLKTLYIWEGVVYYLQAAAVDLTLEFVQTNSSPGSSIIFDYVYTSALIVSHKRGEITRMQRAARFTGEKLIFGIEEGTVADFLKARGFSHITNVSSKDLERIYFTGVNQGRTVAPIYAIVSATVERPASGLSE